MSNCPPDGPGRRPGRLAALFLTLSLGAGLSGCGPPEEAGAEAGPEADDAEVVTQSIIGADEGAEASAAGARLALSAEELRYQARCPGLSGRKTLTVENEGSATLIIRALSVSGRAFSIVEPPKLPRRIKSGERMELTVKFSPPADRPDQLSPRGTLRITSNDAAQGTRSVALKGSVPPMGLTFYPLQVDLGQIRVGATRTTRVELRNGGACALPVGWFDTSGDMADSVLVDNLDQFQLAAGATKRVKVTGLCDSRGDVDAKLRFYTPSNVPLGSVPVSGTCY